MLAAFRSSCGGSLIAIGTAGNFGSSRGVRCVITCPVSGRPPHVSSVSPNCFAISRGSLQGSLLRRSFSTSDGTDARGVSQFDVHSSDGRNPPKVQVIRKSDQELKRDIEKLIKTRKVVLFMKGDPDSPQCGFSRRAVQMLAQCDCVDFTYVDILKSDRLREFVKDLSGWPTFPQLYVGGELVGGCDVMTELFERGELKQILARCSGQNSSQGAPQQPSPQSSDSQGNQDSHTT